MELAGGDAGLAAAGYSGGHAVIDRARATWPAETLRFYRWASGIYHEAKNGVLEDHTLTAWLAAGGSSLSQEAALAQSDL